MKTQMGYGVMFLFYMSNCCKNIVFLKGSFLLSGKLEPLCSYFTCPIVSRTSFLKRELYFRECLMVIRY